MTPDSPTMRWMDIGQPERVVVVEPAENPVPVEQPAPVEPEREPERVPARSRAR